MADDPRSRGKGRYRDERDWRDDPRSAGEEPRGPGPMGDYERLYRRQRPARYEEAPYDREFTPFERHYTRTGYGDWRDDYGRGGFPDQEYDRFGPGEYPPYRYRRGPHRRGWWDRTSDEVASWFGDEDAERRRDEDRWRETHRGRGPRGYTRSDDRIREDVCDRLADNPVLDASDIDLSVSRGEVTLNGTVDSRYSKRLAEDLADDVSGVTHVQNNLRVRRPATATSGVSTPGGETSGTPGTGPRKP